MFEIDEFVADCRAALSETQPRQAIAELLRRAMREPSAVVEALPPTQAEVVAYHASSDLTVLKVVWAPGMSIRPHNHLMWAAIGVYGGREDNTFFRRADGGIVASGGRSLDIGDVALLGDDAIHAVTNPRQSLTAAVHVYGGNLTDCPGRSEWDVDTLEELPYDFERSQQVFSEANAAMLRAAPRSAAD